MQHDPRGADRTRRGHLVDVGDGAQMPLERRRDAGRHGLRAGARPSSPTPMITGMSMLGSGATGSRKKATMPASARPIVSKRGGDRAADEEGREIHGAGAPAASARNSAAEPVEIDVDHRRGEQRQQLADQQAADDGDAERMAQLRARAAAEHQRQRAEQRRHRRHQDGAEAQQRRLMDRLARATCLRCARPRARSRSS